MSKIYLDSAAMHPVIAPARDAFLRAPFGNPSSEHGAGQAARNALEHAREKIASIVMCKPEELYFFSTVTEASATVLSALWLRNYIIDASPYEHHAISENIYRPLSVDSAAGKVYCQQYGNNETGAIEPYPTRKKDYFVCDATASMGHTEITAKMIGNGYLLADALKFGGVPGAAFCVAKKGAPLSPLIRGGGQERGMRSGTENVPAICAMAAALEWQCEHMEANTFKLNTLSDVMRQEISEIPNIQWNTPFDKPHVPHILNISFGGVDAHALALLLSKDGVMVSAGAACSNGKNEPSHVIMNMFHDEARARSAIRISFCKENTVEEVREAAEKIKNAVAYLRSLN